MKILQILLRVWHNLRNDQSILEYSKYTVVLQFIGVLHKQIAILLKRRKESGRGTYNVLNE